MTSAYDLSMIMIKERRKLDDNSLSVKCLLEVFLFFVNKKKKHFPLRIR